MAKRKNTMETLKAYADRFADYLKASFTNFLDSFRKLDWKGFLLVAAYELAFVVIAYLLAVKFQSSVFGFVQSKLPYLPAAGQMAYGADIGPSAEEVAVIAWRVISMILGFTLLYVSLYIVSNSLIWRQIGRKKVCLNFCWRYIAMGLIWVAMWFAFIIVMALSLRQEVMPKWGFGMLLAFLHLGTVMRVAFIKHVKVWKPIGKAFSAGIGKIHHFVVPYIYGGVFFYILHFIIKKIGMTKINVQFYMGMFVIAYVLYFAWARYYINSFAKRIV